MSRTKRRTKHAWDRWDDCPEWRYQSDACMTMQQVPKWYKTQFCRQPFKRKSKAVLDRALQGDQEPVMPLNKKNAQYYW